MMVMNRPPQPNSGNPCGRHLRLRDWRQALSRLVDDILRDGRKHGVTATHQRKTQVKSIAWAQFWRGAGFPRWPTARMHAAFLLQRILQCPQICPQPRPGAPWSVTSRARSTVRLPTLSSAAASDCVAASPIGEAVLRCPFARFANFAAAIARCDSLRWRRPTLSIRAASVCDVAQICARSVRAPAACSPTSPRPALGICAPAGATCPSRPGLGRRGKAAESCPAMRRDSLRARSGSQSAASPSPARRGTAAEPVSRRWTWVSHSGSQSAPITASATCPYQQGSAWHPPVASFDRRSRAGAPSCPCRRALGRRGLALVASRGRTQQPSRCGRPPLAGSAPSPSPAPPTARRSGVRRSGARWPLGI